MILEKSAMWHFLKRQYSVFKNWSHGRYKNHVKFENIFYCLFLVNVICRHKIARHKHTNHTAPTEKNQTVFEKVVLALAVTDTVGISFFRSLKVSKLPINVLIFDVEGCAVLCFFILYVLSRTGKIILRKKTNRTVGVLFFFINIIIIIKEMMTSFQFELTISIIWIQAEIHSK